MGDLHIAEIPHPSGGLKYRYSRNPSDDGQRRTRHGPFFAHYEDGALKSEGSYEHGLEHGLWRDYHPHNVAAAEGLDENGVEIGVWRFWNVDGIPEPSVDYDNVSEGDKSGPTRRGRDEG